MTTTFRYDSEARRGILAALPPQCDVGLQITDPILALEALASTYLRRVRLANAAALQKQMLAVNVVLDLLQETTDYDHCQRLRQLGAELEREWLIAREPARKRRARTIFVCDLLTFWLHLDQPATFVEELPLSDSSAPLRRFLDAALQPVLALTGQSIEIRRLIAVVAGLQNELRDAEIEALGYAAKGESF